MSNKKMVERKGDVCNRPALMVSRRAGICSNVFQKEEKCGRSSRTDNNQLLL